MSNDCDDQDDQASTCTRASASTNGEENTDSSGDSGLNPVKD